MPATFRSLRNRNAKYFFAGVLVSNIGTWMQFTASAFLLYRLTGRATDLGLNVMFQFLPMLLLGAWAGTIADRHNRRRMTLITQSGLAIQSIVLGVLDLTGNINIGVVYVLSLALGVINAFDNPARRGLVTELVDVDDIGNAVSLNTAAMTGSRILGPALAATLVGPLGTGWLFVINGLSFAAILLGIVAMDVSLLRVAPPAPRGGRPVREAIGFIRNDHVLRPLFIVLVIVSTFAFNYSVVLPKLADARWGSENSFGWLLAVVSVGSLIGSLMTAGRETVSLRWFNWTVFVLAVSNIALAWAPNLALAFVFAVPLGIGGAGFIASVNAISQVMSPPNMRGRLLALGAVAFLGSTPIGGPVTGWIADHVSPEWSLGYGGVIALLCWAWMATVMKRGPQSVA
ncbi:MAG: MFS transporter [Actinobacteria bacterium]|nr:MFS transporter [Actinomycetota bacterium]